MKVTILYRGDSEQEHAVKEFENEYMHRTGRMLFTSDVNDKDGAALAELYDIVRFPAVLATTEDGSVLQLWQDGNLPLMNEVMYYDRPA